MSSGIAVEHMTSFPDPGTAWRVVVGWVFGTTKEWE